MSVADDTSILSSFSKSIAQKLVHGPIDSTISYVKQKAIEAAVICVGGVGVTFAMAGKAFFSFQPAPTPGGIDRLIDALGRLGQESSSKRIARQINYAYWSILGLVGCRTLYNLNNAGAHSLRKQIKDEDAKQASKGNGPVVDWYHENGKVMNYYDYDAKDYATIMTSDWEGDAIKTSSRTCMNVLIGLCSYTAHLGGVGDEIVEDSAAILDKGFKILFFEEVLARLLEIHGYEALSGAAFGLSAYYNTGKLPSWHGVGGNIRATGLRGIPSALTRVGDVLRNELS